MHEIKAFKAKDGTMFESEEEAARHELKQFVRVWLAEVSTSDESIVDSMVEDADELATVLNSYIRARGPVKRKVPGSWEHAKGESQ